jgi:malate dehydrogenase
LQGIFDEPILRRAMKRIVVSGAAGQIAYSLVFRLAHGDLLGPNQKIALHLLDLPQGEAVLKGVAMELDDCAFPLLKEVKIGSDPEEMFGGVDYAFLVGAKPRGPGMERKDLLQDNAKIFVEQGRALDKAASKDVRVLVVGNPANTNCLIAMHHAPSIPKNQFHSMMRLDQNRAVSQLAKRAGISIEDVKKMVVWGNHSSTQVPDFINAHVGSKKMIEDRKWLEEEFIPKIQKRGAEVIAARGKSSAASAANAAVDSMRALLTPTPSDTWFSAGVYSNGNPYGIADDLVFSFPLRSKGKGDWEIVEGLKSDPFLKAKIALSEKELLEERDLIKHLLRGI